MTKKKKQGVVIYKIMSDPTLNAKRKLPHIYDKDYQTTVQNARQLICTGKDLEKKQRKSGMFGGGNWKTRNCWVPSQGKFGLKTFFWIHMTKKLRGNEQIRREHLMEEARKKGNYFEFKDITDIAHDEKNRKQFIIHDVHHSDARFRCPSEKEAKAWVEGLTLVINDKLRYLLEFTGGDTTTEISFKKDGTEIWEEGTICDYLFTQQQIDKGLPGIHVVAISDGMGETVYQEVDFALTEYHLKRGKNKNFAHERVGKEVELYQKMKKLNQMNKLKIKGVDGKVKKTTITTTTTKTTTKMNLPPPPAFALPPPSDDDTPMKRLLVKVKKILGEQNILLEMPSHHM